MPRSGVALASKLQVLHGWHTLILVISQHRHNCLCTVHVVSSFCLWYREKCFVSVRLQTPKANLFEKLAYSAYRISKSKSSSQRPVMAWQITALVTGAVMWLRCCKGRCSSVSNDKSSLAPFEPSRIQRHDHSSTTNVIARIPVAWLISSVILA